MVQNYGVLKPMTYNYNAFTIKNSAFDTQRTLSSI
jgi:hypothetical protein